MNNDFSVDFDEMIPIHGKDGYTPVRGVDYWTEEDKAEIKKDVQQMINVALGEIENGTY